MATATATNKAAERLYAYLGQLPLRRGDVPDVAWHAALDEALAAERHAIVKQMMRLIARFQKEGLQYAANAIADEFRDDIDSILDGRTS